MYTLLILTFTVYCMSYILAEDHFSRNTKVFINCFLVLFFSLMMAFRPMTVPDTLAYTDRYLKMDVFTRYPVSSMMVTKFSFEVGYVAFNQFIKFFAGNFYRILLFVIPAINIGLITFASKRIMCHVDREVYGMDDGRGRKFNFVLMLCLYTCYFGLLYNGIILRAGLALSLLFCAFAMYMDKKYISMAAFFALAFAFHRMALIGMFIVLIYHILPALKRKHYLYIWSSIGIFALIHGGDRLIKFTVSFIQMIFSRVSFLTFSHYLDNLKQGQIGFKNVFFYLIGLVLLLKEVNSKIYYKILNIYYLGLLVMVFINSIAGAGRIYDYMNIYMVMALYIIYEYSRGEKKDKWYIMLTIVLLGNILVISLWRLI